MEGTASWVFICGLVSRIHLALSVLGKSHPLTSMRTPLSTLGTFLFGSSPLLSTGNWCVLPVRAVVAVAFSLSSGLLSPHRQFRFDVECVFP